MSFCNAVNKVQTTYPNRAGTREDHSPSEFARAQWWWVLLILVVMAAIATQAATVPAAPNSASSGWAPITSTYYAIDTAGLCNLLYSP
jgi:hypothetical protein